MKSNTKIRFLLPFSIAIYIIGIVLMCIGTVFDLDIAKSVFQPQSAFAIGFEAFGLAVYWGMWGSIFTVLYLTRHNLKDTLRIISAVFPFIKIEPNTQSKTYRVFNRTLDIFLTLLYFVLAVVGWKKVIENVLNDIFDLSQFVYFFISMIATGIGVHFFSKLNRETLKKLELLSLAAVLLGIFFKIFESTKTITSRVRFREMVAFSNGILDENGMSAGKTKMLVSPLTHEMASNTDFSAFTQWFKLGNDMGIYTHADSFPSGHTFSSCTIFLSSLFCTAFEKLKKYAPFMLCVSFVYVSVMGYSRMVAGAHYLTDVAAGLLIGYTAFLLVYFVYNKFIEKEIIYRTPVFN